MADMWHPYGLSRREWAFAVLISSVHATQHLFLRIVPPLIPLLVIDLDLPLWQLGFLVTLHMLAGGLVQAPVGVLADRLDRLRLLVPAIGCMSIGYLVFALGAVAGGFSPTFELFGATVSGTYQLMAVGIVVAGVGYGVIHPVGYPLISANVAGDNKGSVLGMWGSASKLGDAAAPLLIGAMILIWPWWAVVAAIGGFGLLYAAGLLAAFRAGDFETGPPVGEHGDAGLSADEEGRADPRLFWLPMAVILVFYLFTMFTATGLVTYTPVFVTDVYAYEFSLGSLSLGPESVANFYLSILLVSGAISQLLVGGLADVYDPRTLLVGLLAIAAIGVLALAALPVSALLLVGVFVLIGCCIFGVNPVRDGLITEITPPAYEGRTFGTFWTIVLLVSAIYPTVIGYLGDVAGLRTSFVTLGVTAVLAAASVALLYSSRVYLARTGTGVT